MFFSGEASEFLEKVVRTLSVYMSDRASNEKKSNHNLDACRLKFTSFTVWLMCC